VFIKEKLKPAVYHYQNYIIIMYCQVFENNDENKIIIQQIFDDQVQSHKSSKKYKDNLPTINEMVKMWRTKNPFFSSSIVDEHSAQLVAEAWYWTSELGLFHDLTTMGFNTAEKLKTYRPLDIRMKCEYAPKELRKKIDMVCDKLTVPSWSHEASYALWNAAWSCFTEGWSEEEIEKNKK